MNLQGTIIFDQPEDVSNYIKAKIVEPDNDPMYSSEGFQNRIQGLNDNVNEYNRLLVFPATYNKIDNMGETVIVGFPANWCHKVTIEIQVKDNCPSGDYVVAIDAMNPTNPIVEEYNWLISGDPFYSFFFPAIREFRPKAPYFQAIITVV